jgi:hypothetical protein
MEPANTSQTPNDNSPQNSSIKDGIIDLMKLSTQHEIKNSEIILAIIEICTFNKKYNYDCSNNTKAFWDRVVEEGILKKIFKNFKGETLRKYWKIIRNAGNNEKFVEAVRKNEKFINNPVFKLLPLVNAIAYYIQTDEKNFEDFFTEFNAKSKKSSVPKVERGGDKEEKKEKCPINLLGNKRNEPDNNNKEHENQIHIETNNNNNTENPLALKEPTFAHSEPESEKDQRMIEFDDIVNKLMTISKLSREEVLVALYGTSFNIKNAYLYMKDNEKYEKYFFLGTDDYVIKNLKDKGYYVDLKNIKGEDLLKERQKFLGIK